MCCVSIHLTEANTLYRMRRIQQIIIFGSAIWKLHSFAPIGYTREWRMIDTRFLSRRLFCRTRIYGFHLQMLRLNFCTLAVYISVLSSRAITYIHKHIVIEFYRNEAKTIGACDICTMQLLPCCVGTYLPLPTNTKRYKHVRHELIEFVLLKLARIDVTRLNEL